MSSFCYVVRNGEWFLSEGPSWSVSTWTTIVDHATKYESMAMARLVAKEAVTRGHRPFGRAPEFAKAGRIKQ
jgi:hypothetical protein